MAEERSRPEETDGDPGEFESAPGEGLEILRPRTGGPDAEAPLRVGEYEIIERIGAGGMGIVFKARPRSGGGVVALKMLGPALDRAEDRDRFRREVHAVQGLDAHPGLVPILDVGQDAHTCYFVMEYVEGLTLREVMHRLADHEGPIPSVEGALAAMWARGAPAPVDRFLRTDRASSAPPGVAAPKPGRSAPTPAADGFMRQEDYLRWCCRVVRDAAEALAHAHARGVFHRDVKPENLMLEAGGRVRVIDFGIARAFEDSTITRSGQMLGTPMYMSPEQVRGEPDLNARVDVYALGLVLYELLTLRPPYPARNLADLYQRILDQELYAVSRKNPGVPPDLEAIVHQATAKDPERRHRSAASLAEDLGRWLDRRPRPLPRYKYRPNRRMIRANRPQAITLVAFVFYFAAIALGWLALMDAFLGTAYLLTDRFVVPRSGGTGSGAGALLLESSALAAEGLVAWWVGSGLYLGRRRWPALVAILLALGLGVLGLRASFSKFLVVLRQVNADPRSDLGFLKLALFNLVGFPGALICLVLCLIAIARAPTGFFDAVAKLHRQEE